MSETTPLLGGRPLDGVRVLDFTRVLSGPYATSLLADLGAEVIKVESPGGDDYRHVGPFHADGSSAIFEAVNRGKRGLVLDLARPDHRAIARDLAVGADVVVENFRPGVADKLGIGWADLSLLQPRLIHASISGFGQEGSDARRPAYDIVVQAMSGLMHVTGDPEGPPTLVGESIADVVSGLFAALGIVAALAERDRTGRGRRIDVSMFDSLMALQPLVVARCLATGIAPMRVGNRHPLSAPFGAYAAKDGSFVVAVLNEKLFAALCAVMDRPDCAADPRFATDPDRLANEPLLRVAIEDWADDLSAAEAVARLVAAGVPAAEVADTATALDGAEARGRPITQTVAHPSLGSLTVPEQPIRFSGAPRGVSAPAPRLGEHGAAVLEDPFRAWSPRR
ncbi:CaiB/BaiF CoA transferase family protein [Pinisolibacter aquiterrae]|uniref:CaiB/BaiF CoA transferase family protein n=1 Tax=Pinisolibacter aquiterrae TaxID=2815579 RepID=UPI001C3E0DCF|nr:CoA transferase [Pinisolibacter aquiterrae]MBV5263728.1 CoA transferase [Pinisolibacter aquiterrae]MCC8235074.1 CoA transferase [Pinisolibacter aquiterrae]